MNTDDDSDTEDLLKEYIDTDINTLKQGEGNLLKSTINRYFSS